MKNKDGSFVVLFKDNKQEEVFLVYRSDMPIWNLPGGGIEEKENSLETAIRETTEETSFVIEILHMLGTYKNINVNTGGIWNTTYLFEGRVLSGSFVPEFDGCRGEWFHINALPTEVNEVTKIRIEDALSYQGVVFEKEYHPKPQKPKKLIR